MFDLVKIFSRSHAHMRHVSPFEIQPIASVCVRIVERKKSSQICSCNGAERKRMKSWNLVSMINSIFTSISRIK
jgi:hypothetical protein